MTVVDTREASLLRFVFIGMAKHRVTTFVWDLWRHPPNNTYPGLYTIAKWGNVSELFSLTIPTAEAQQALRENC